MSALSDAMKEYAEAIRGDWSDFDGRSERGVIWSWVEYLDKPDEKPIEAWRAELGLCPDGNGHWGGKWGHCSESECPTYAKEMEEA